LTSIDIAASLPGSTTIVTPGSGYNVTAGGPGITGNSDGFRFLYQQQTGNFDVMVQVESLTVAGNFATAGIMARSTLAADSADVYMSASPTNFRFKDRPTTGTGTAITASGSVAFPNVWLRLSRVGNLFTAYTSTDGMHWTEFSSITLSLPTSLDLGLAVASNDTTDTTTAQLLNYGNTVTPPVVVPTPTGLIATGISGGVSLQWNAVTYANLTGYDIYSSTSSGGTYTLLTPTPITQTSFTDNTAPGGETIYYRVTAVDATTATQSTPATASAAATFAPILTSLDLNTSQPGSTTIVTPGSAYDVTAGGPGVTSTSDGFRFLYTQESGDFDVKVQVSSLTVAGNFSTAGIMARASLADDSEDVYMSASPVNYRFKDRTSTGGNTNIVTGAATSFPNVWLRLSRVGNLFTAYTSTDGVHWTVMSSVTMSLPNTIFLGLAVASNDTTDTTTAQLQDFSNT
jgi:regulation of enolase protein 1 (concanavalin A-like superfamily)